MMKTLLISNETIDSYLKRAGYSPGICAQGQEAYKNIAITPRPYNEAIDVVNSVLEISESERQSWLSLMHCINNDAVSWLQVGKSTAINDLYYVKNLHNGEYSTFLLEELAISYREEAILTHINNRVKATVAESASNDEEYVRLQLTAAIDTNTTRRFMGPFRSIMLPDGRSTMTLDYNQVL